MTDIFKYVYFEGDFSNMANMADGVITYKGDTIWCKYSDVEPLEKRIKELEETNRLLCRDLDEAQRRIEELTGISV